LYKYTPGWVGRVRIFWIKSMKLRRQEASS
jgi:hypothetical protein